MDCLAESPRVEKALSMASVRSLLKVVVLFGNPLASEVFAAKSWLETS